MKQKVTNIKTKEVITVEAIDAREMVKSGGWEIGELIDSGMVKKKAGTKNPGKVVSATSDAVTDKAE